MPINVFLDQRTPSTTNLRVLPSSSGEAATNQLKAYASSRDRQAVGILLNDRRHDTPLPSSKINATALNNSIAFRDCNTCSPSKQLQNNRAFPSPSSVLFRPAPKASSIKHQYYPGNASNRQWSFRERG